MVGIGKGAENNILIRDAEALELAHKMNAIVLDKTGTITEGKPSVESIEWLTEEDKITAENVLFSLERLSEHPLAESVVRHLQDSARPVTVSDVKSLTGKGITGIFDHKKYHTGGLNLMKDAGISIESRLQISAARWEENAGTVIYFADDKEVLAVLSVTDRIRQTSGNTIKQLQSMNIDTYLVTGDNIKTAGAVAKKTGIANFKAGMLPSDNAEFIKTLQKQGKIVGMVGDGINDSQALAAADVSIAMGKGSDIAIDAAKMTIISNDLSVIPSAIRLSRNTVKTIRQNLFWAFIYNIIGIPIAAGILFPVNGFLLNPMIAGAAMALSSVSVVSNSLRLKYLK
jgi:Cu2+-exporting ATPase